MQIHQLIHTLSYGDAISGECLALQRCLHELGISSKIFAINTHPVFKGMTEDYRLMPVDFDGQVILHYSLGSPLNDLFRSLVSAKRSIIFHNLTPSEYFKGINPRVAADIQKGWQELPELCRLCDQVVSDSFFNASELKVYGIDSKILPLPFDPKRWEDPVNSGFEELIESESGIHLLHIGRLAPNKCIEDVIKTFYYLKHRFPEHKSRLWLAGIDTDTELYSYGLKRLAQELTADEYINFTGQLSDGELKALYSNCTAYLCMSEHEGFCVPVIEAMHFGLPVLAYSNGAVPETVGNGGILFSEKRYHEIAALIVKIHTDSELRSKLKKAGSDRVLDFSYDNFKARVRDLYLNSDK